MGAVSFTNFWLDIHIYIYIYIYREREREREASPILIIESFLTESTERKLENDFQELRLGDSWGKHVNNPINFTFDLIV